MVKHEVPTGYEELYKGVRTKIGRKLLDATVAYHRQPDFGWDIWRDLEYQRVFREWTSLAITPFSTSRDADALTRSNFRVIKRKLEEIAPYHVDTQMSRHWAVGWTENIMVDPGHTQLAMAVMKWVETLEECRIIDEDDLAVLEREDYMEHLRSEVRSEIVEEVQDYLATVYGVHGLDELSYELLEETSARVEASRKHPWFADEEHPEDPCDVCGLVRDASVHHVPEPPIPGQETLPGV
ncbi:hypothetical protein [Nocardiopsis sp. JB363]|uniref:hypothetical protein n=1 Tax=Nocardiopsis sp. JB363 TaxID=1434837 RepID=UPI00117D6E66|nr:hypothetical protein [Nocardiopsis sp. JB363]